MKCVAFVVILAALSSAKGRVLQDTPTFETVSYDGTYSTGMIDSLAKFPYFDSGSECTAYIRVLGSPYAKGNIQLQILYATPQAQDALKNVLCDLMRTGEDISLSALEESDSNEGIIYDGGSDGKILIDSNDSEINLRNGHFYFAGCSC